MELTAQRRLLITLTAGCCAAAVGAVLWSIRSLDQVSERPAASLDAQQDVKRSAGNSVVSASDNGIDTVNLSLPLLKPLYDPPKQPPKQPPKPRAEPKVVRTPTPPPVKVPRLDWTLNGTIIDPRRSVAILTDTTGKTDIRGVGEEVELSPPGVLVRKIDSDNVTLEVRGKESTLRLKQSFGSGASADPDRQNRRRNR